MEEVEVVLTEVVVVDGLEEVVPVVEVLLLGIMESRDSESQRSR